MRPDGTEFWQFLRRHQIPFDKDDFPFLTKADKAKVRQVFDFEEYLSLGSRGAALAYLYRGLGKSLDYVGPVLDLDMKHGFNDHTDRHTLWVAQTGVELMQRSGKSSSGERRYNAASEVLMTLVGMMHDLGNFLGRKDHSTYSAWMMTRLFGNWYARRKEWDLALYSILFHEEPVLLETGLDLESGCPLQWALVAADKMHVGRDRVGGRSFETGVDQGALEEDAHILLNALIVRSAWYLKDGCFIWHLGFSVDQLEDKFEAFTAAGSDRLWMPGMYQRRFVKKGVKYRETFAHMFVKIYGNRMEMLAKSVFLLMPYLHEVRVELSDIDTRDKVGSGEMLVWGRENELGLRGMLRKGVGEGKWWGG